MQHCHGCKKDLPTSCFDHPLKRCKTCVGKYKTCPNNLWDTFPQFKELVNPDFYEKHKHIKTTSIQQTELTCPECEEVFITTPKEMCDFGFFPCCGKYFIELNKKELQEIVYEQIQSAESFDDYEQAIKKFTPIQLGFMQEVFCKFYFTAHSKLYDIKKYFSYSLDKTTDIIKLGLPPRDMGSDAVIIHNDDSVSLIQVKWRGNKTCHDRSVFYGMSIDALQVENLRNLFLFSNSTKISIHLPKGDKFKYILYPTIASIDWEFFKASISMKKEEPVKEIVYRDWQIEASDFVQDKDLATIVAACGAGKTLAAYKILKEQKVNNCLIIVPSLQLLSQWFYNLATREPKMEFLLIGSSHDSDSINVPYHLTTSPKIIKGLLKKPKKNLITISTFQSLDVLVEAVGDFKYNTTFIDEAHVTTGGGNFSIVTKDNFPTKRKIFLTATPKIYKGGLKQKLISMDNEDVYGEHFVYSCRQAIKDKILCPYTVALGSAMIEDNFPDENRFDLYTRFLLICIKDYGLKRILIASNTHATSNKFYQFFKKRYNGNHELVLMKAGASASDKNDVLARIKTSEMIIFNVRIFNLGVDIPNLDAVMFNGDKGSKTDIVQTAMRCLRTCESKKRAYILVPAFFGEELNVKDEGDYCLVRNTLLALGKQDPKLFDEIVSKSTKAINKRTMVRSAKDIIQTVNVEDCDFDLDEVLDSVETRLFSRFGEVLGISESVKFEMWKQEVLKVEDWVSKSLIVNGIKIGIFQDNLKGTLSGRTNGFSKLLPKWKKDIKTFEFWPTMKKSLDEIIIKRKNLIKTPEEKFEILIIAIKKYKFWIPVKTIIDGIEIGKFQDKIKQALTNPNNTRFKTLLPKWKKRFEALSFYAEMKKSLDENIEKRTKIQLSPNEKFNILIELIKKLKYWVPKNTIINGINISAFQDRIKHTLNNPDSKDARFKLYIQNWKEQLQTLSCWKILNASLQNRK